MRPVDVYWARLGYPRPLSPEAEKALEPWLQVARENTGRIHPALKGLKAGSQMMLMVEVLLDEGPMTSHQLAHLVGSSPDCVSRTMKILAARGSVEVVRMGPDIFGRDTRKVWGAVDTEAMLERAAREAVPA